MIEENRNGCVHGVAWLEKTTIGVDGGGDVWLGAKHHFSSTWFPSCLDLSPYPGETYNPHLLKRICNWHRGSGVQHPPASNLDPTAVRGITLKERGLRLPSHAITYTTLSTCDGRRAEVRLRVRIQKNSLLSRWRVLPMVIGFSDEEAVEVGICGGN